MYFLLPQCPARDDLNPWWQLDLGSEHWLGTITVTLRADFCGSTYILNI